MCVSEIDSAIRSQETLGSDISKGAMFLAKTFSEAINKMSQKTNEKIERQARFCTEKWKEIKDSNEELKQRINDIETKVDDKFDTLNKKIDNYIQGTSFSKAIGDLFLAMFRSPKRATITIITFTVLVGAANIKDIIELFKIALA